ncbi:MAG: hypothetical protein AAF805_02370 [Planctomycetota bacterium]
MSSDRRRSLIAGAAAFCLLTSCLTVAGCGYGPVSDAAYGHAQALYTAANMKSDKSIAASRAAIEQDAESGALSEREAGVLLDACADAESGDWSSTTAAMRRLMDDQVSR